MDIYREQAGCVDCKYIFVKMEYDEQNVYYCTHNAPDRPPCLSCYMEESSVFDYIGNESEEDHSKKVNAAFDLWEKWSKNREVQTWGICDDHATQQEGQADNDISTS